MKTFEYRRARSVSDAVDLAVATGGRYYAGGTNLLDLMKNGVEAPEVVIDVGGLGLRDVTERPDGSVLVGAGIGNGPLANHRLIRTRYPVLSQAILSGATTQLRNMATAGGNLLQRTRCPYFMDPAFEHCDKRVPGSGCAARTGFHREHAIFGTTGSCIAVHPSDMGVALALLDARVHVRGPEGDRAVDWQEFWRLPGDHPERDHALGAHELVVGIELPPSRYAERSWYAKVRDRHSYAFALVSVAVGLHVVDGTIEQAAVALGGVAATPWRSRAAEALLVGASPGDAAFRACARALLSDAEPLRDNAFKVDLAKHTVVAALARAAALPAGAAG